MNRILFICKRNETYGFVSYTRRSSGLYNSTRFIVEAMNANGIEAKIVEVIDNNCIDREVNSFKPDIVVIEALWVVPAKFDVLKKLHPKVNWYVHLHSHIPFLALEGIAMKWLYEYRWRGIKVIANSKPSFEALKVVCGSGEVFKPDLIYLPNVYISKALPPVKPRTYLQRYVHIGCFGAIRPLKNQLLQAMAAIKYAYQTGSRLTFHVNASRVETNGSPVLRNIIELFEEGSKRHKLVQHEWHEPEDFIEMLHNNIDIGMQVSLTETFNVVSADYITAGLPIVVSKEVSWASCFSKAKDDCIDDIVAKLHRADSHRWLIKQNQKLLRKNAEVATKMWVKEFK